MKNKLTRFLFLLAAVGFIFTFTGGQYLHEKIHHHTSVQSQQECPVYILLGQVAFFVPFALLAACLKIQKTFLPANLASDTFHSVFLPSLRAPPLSLL